MEASPSHVCFTPESGHWFGVSGCPLCAKSRHSAAKCFLFDHFVAAFGIVAGKRTLLNGPRMSAKRQDVRNRGVSGFFTSQRRTVFNPIGIPNTT
jgi:hypothetical protein